MTWLLKERWATETGPTRTQASYIADAVPCQTTGWVADPPRSASAGQLLRVSARGIDPSCQRGCLCISRERRTRWEVCELDELTSAVRRGGRPPTSERNFVAPICPTRKGIVARVSRNMDAQLAIQLKAQWVAGGRSPETDRRNIPGR